MGMFDNLKGQFVETLVNRIVDTKKIELSISFNDKKKLPHDVIKETESKDLVTDIIQNKDIKVEVEFKNK